MKNILEWIETAQAQDPNRPLFADDVQTVTRSDFVRNAQAIGTALARLDTRNAPIAILLPRSVSSLIAMMGVVYSGNFYVVLDDLMPSDRMSTILRTLKPTAILAGRSYQEQAAALEFQGRIFCYEEAAETPVEQDTLHRIRSRMVDTDPLYALFTSGSTGVPKGTVVSHRSVIAYINWFTNTFSIDETTVFGSQTPFYFSMSVSDVFSTMKTGASLHIIQKTLFSFPIRLLEFLQQRQVNTIYWVPSAMCILSNWKIFQYAQWPSLHTVLFAGEVMPTRHLNYWIAQLPGVRFANLFGPTETTDICTYYVVDRPFADYEPLPIGRACDNCDVFVVTEDGKEAEADEEGELYARGSFLAMGYYNNPEKTAAAFVQNPLNPHYPELVYKTGDLVRWNDRGELIYLTRKDFQIKHMGYRIELGEIEAAAGALEQISVCCCVYDSQKDQLILIWQGKKCSEEMLMTGLKRRLPNYMLPGLLIRTTHMPYNANGKLDRKWLGANYEELL